MKKICFLIPTLERGGGAERVCVFLADAFQKKGYDVSIQLLFNCNKDIYPLASNIRVYRPPCYRLGVYGAVMQFLLCRLFQRNLPDCVIAFLWPANVFASVLARFTNIKVILTERCNPQIDPPDKKSFDRVKRISPVLSLFIAQTTGCGIFMKNYLKLDERKIKVIFNPVFPRKYKETQQTSKKLLAVGRLAPQKGFDRLIRIFKHIVSLFPDAQLTICGDGPLKDDLLQIAKSLSVDSKIIWAGNVANIDDYYQNADIMLFTSHFEGMPNAVLEAYANGCPVISFDLDFGPRDIITNNVNGILVPQNDEEAFAKELTRYLKDPSLRQKFVSNIPDLLEKFRPEHIVDQWEEAIEQTTGDVQL